MRIRICVAKFMMHSMITNLQKNNLIHKRSKNLDIFDGEIVFSPQNIYLPNRRCNFEMQLNLQWLKLDAFYNSLCMIDGPIDDEHRLLCQYHQIFHTRTLRNSNSIVKCISMDFPVILNLHKRNVYILSCSVKTKYNP